MDILNDPLVNHDEGPTNFLKPELQQQKIMLTVWLLPIAVIHYIFLEYYRRFTIAVYC